MQINIKLDKDFERQFNKLVEKYGEDFLKLQGLDDDKLSFTNFIDGFVDSDNVANASIDANANVGHKDVVTLLNEMAKPHQKLLSYNKIYYEIKKKYGYKEANKWFELEWNKTLYMHDSHTSSFFSYCFAYDLKDVAEKGLFFIENFNSEPPKHLESFIDFVKEHCSYCCNRSAGAVAYPNLIPYMWYFWNKDCENGYYLKDPDTYANQQIQRLIYSLNQPYLRSGIQSAFTNVNFFDHYYFEAIFGGSEFPDGSFMIDYEEEIIDFQKRFLTLMSEMRSKNMMTYPVSTISLLTDENGNFKDEEFAKWCCEHNRKWNDSNWFVDNNVTSLSSCCFDGKQMCLTKSSKGVNYMSFEDLYNAPSEYRQNLTVFHNGSWVKGKIIKTKAKDVFKIVTSNKKELFATADHIFPTYHGDKNVAELTTDDYLMFNSRNLDTYPEKDRNLSYEEGFLVGMYLGDGSSEQKKNFTPSIHLSLNEDKYNKSYKIIEDAINKLDNTAKFVLNKEYNNVYPTYIRSWAVYNFVKEWVIGNYSYEKELNLDCLLQSNDFRKGILDGYYLTDGGNSNRIYTSSPKMAECMEVLLTSLGLNSIIDISDRTDEPVIIRGEIANRNYPIYCIRWYSPKNKRSAKNIYKIKNNSEYFKIVSIDEYNHSDEYVYCFEMSNKEEPYFTLPNGVITHNCRLKNDINELNYFNSIGGTALKVGSIKVSTLNLARISYMSNSEKEYLNNLKDILTTNLKALDCQRHIIKRNYEKGLLPNFNHKLVEFEFSYSSIGIMGIYETMRKFGYTYEDKLGNVYYSPKAYDFGRRIFKEIHKIKDEFKKDKDYNINLEAIPGESCGVKFAKADRMLYPDIANRDLPLLANQWIGLGVKTTLAERINIASSFSEYCSGGDILHINIDAPFDSFEKAWDMLNFVAKKGVKYFAFTGKISACKNNHAFYGETCPECGEPKETEYQRVVGFFTPIKSYSKERKEESNLRDWMPLNTNGVLA